MRKVMYIAINIDLNMSPGKIGAHAGHAVFDYLLESYCSLDEYKYYSWGDFAGEFKKFGDTMIILKGTTKDMLKWEKEGLLLLEIMAERKLNLTA